MMNCRKKQIYLWNDGSFDFSWEVLLFIWWKVDLFTFPSQKFLSYFSIFWSNSRGFYVLLTSFSFFSLVSRIKRPHSLVSFPCSDDFWPHCSVSSHDQLHIFNHVPDHLFLPISTQHIHFRLKCNREMKLWFAGYLISVNFRVWV